MQQTKNFFGFWDWFAVEVCLPAWNERSEERLFLG